MAEDPEARPVAAELEDELRAFATASGATSQTVAAWLGEMFPPDVEPPVRRRLDSGSNASVMIAAGSRPSRPSGIQAAALAETAPGIVLAPASVLAPVPEPEVVPVPVPE